MTTPQVGCPSIIASILGKVKPVAVLSRGTAPLGAQAIQQLDRLTETAEIEEMSGSSGELRRWGNVVGQAHSDRRVGTIREPHDEVWIGSTPNPDDRDLLAVERMMWMGDGYRFRSQLGR